MIRLENVEKVYRTARIETVALSGVNLDVAEGEFVSVMGPSGCGKSTLLHIIGLLDLPTRGTVQINGAPVASAGDRHLAALRNKELGFVFQTFHLVNDLTVLDNVQVPLLYRRMSNGERRTRGLEAIDRVGLSARAHHFPSQLSGGQQQRVAIARAIVGKPRILLAENGRVVTRTPHTPSRSQPIRPPSSSCAEEAQLLGSLTAEQARWTDFSNRLDELERSLMQK